MASDKERSMQLLRETVVSGEIPESDGIDLSWTHMITGDLNASTPIDCIYSDIALQYDIDQYMINNAADPAGLIKGQTVECFSELNPDIHLHHNMDYHPNQRCSRDGLYGRSLKGRRTLNFFSDQYVLSEPSAFPQLLNSGEMSEVAENDRFSNTNDGLLLWVDEDDHDVHTATDHSTDVSTCNAWELGSDLRSYICSSDHQEQSHHAVLNQLGPRILEEEPEAADELPVADQYCKHRYRRSSPVGARRHTNISIDHLQDGWKTAGAAAGTRRSRGSRMIKGSSMYPDQKISLFGQKINKHATCDQLNVKSKLAYPFELVKPCGVIDGDATLDEINQHINSSAYNHINVSTNGDRYDPNVQLPPCSHANKSPAAGSISTSDSTTIMSGNYTQRVCSSPAAPSPHEASSDVPNLINMMSSTSTSTSGCLVSSSVYDNYKPNVSVSFSGKSVVALTKIHTQGSGSITIRRTRG